MIMIMIYIYIVPCIRWDHKVLYIYGWIKIYWITSTPSITKSQPLPWRGCKLFRKELLHFQSCSPSSLLQHLGCSTVI